MKKEHSPSKKKGNRLKTVDLLLGMPYNVRKANRYFVLFFFIWAFLLYGNTLLNDFAVDDEFVTNNETIRKGVDAIPEIFTTHYIDQKGTISDNVTDYRPLVKLTYAVEYQIFQKDNPGRSHALNVLIYFLLSTLLFFILKRLLRDYNILFPFLITVVFMAHPVHTEVVASLKNRDEMLAFFFGLATLHSLLKFADTRKSGYVLSAMLLFVMGYLSKASILPFVLICPLTLYFFTDLKPKHYLPVAAGILILALLCQLLPEWFLPDGERMTSMMENPLFTEKGALLRLGTGLVSLLFYLKILIYPHPLLFYYGYDTIPLTTPTGIWALLSFILYAGMLIFALNNLRQKQVISFAILWYLIFIAMYSNFLVPVVGIVGERFVFAASLGFCIALIWAIFRIFNTEPNSLTIEFDARMKILAVTFLILIPYVALTVNRNREWKDLLSLYSADIPYLKSSAKVNAQYAGLLMRDAYGDPGFRQYGTVDPVKVETMKKHFLQSLKIFPQNYQTLNDLGTVYLFFDHNPDSAVLLLKRAISLNPSLEPAWVNLGMAYKEVHKPDSAAWCYSTILQNNPRQIRAWFALANSYFDMGDLQRAIEMNQEVIKSNPALDIPYINIGNYWLQTGDTLKAIENYVEALNRRMTSEGCSHVSALYKSLGDTLKSDQYRQMASEGKQQP
ncbi:MAG: tetratricopeptide repeat protein [Bacteroidales bacterium]|nr:tetratricopeptide repeat protein [Bacteroidales bacterium]